LSIRAFQFFLGCSIVVNWKNMCNM
jgi:hypothetical protein